MFSGIVVVFVSAPDVPVIIAVAAPAVAVMLTVSVTVCEVFRVVPKLAVTPAGNPDADKLTLPVNPPEGVIVILLLPLSPWVMLKLAGEADNVKFPIGEAGGKTHSLTSWRIPTGSYKCCHWRRRNPNANAANFIVIYVIPSKGKAMAVVMPTRGP